MRLAIIGSRTFNDYDLLSYHISLHWDSPEYGWGMTEVVSGGAQGADAMGARWAREHDIKLTEYLPDWDTYGKRAGFVRNETIVSNSDFVLAFWDGVSKGTGNSVSIAKRLKKPTLIIYV